MRNIRKWYDNFDMIPELHTSKSPHARVIQLEDSTWHLEIPAHSKSVYHLAQLDDHGSRQRRDFPWHPPLKLNLQARASAIELPGTWGFGLWNEPFSFLIAYGGKPSRLPTLPNAAWFFHASPDNYLSFRDDLPGSGFLAATFRSGSIPFGLLALAAPVLALALVPGAAQVARRFLRRLTHQDTRLIDSSVMEWHTYGIEWEAERVCFTLDGSEIFQTNVVPHEPLSLVLWIDNQYAALPPRGSLRYGTLPNRQPAWLEIRELSVQGELDQHKIS